MLADLRYGCRSLLRSPGFTLVNVLTLGLGAGAAISILALLDAVLVRPLSLADPDHTVTLHRRLEERIVEGFMYPELQQVSQESGEVFDAVGGSGVLPVHLTTSGGARMALVAFVTERFFDVVGVQPVLGRGFAAAEHRPGASPVVIVTDAFWRSQLGADSAVAGARLRTGKVESTVVGVLPERFRGLDLTRRVDVFMPLGVAPLVVPAMNFFADTAVTIDGQSYSPMRWITIAAKLRPEVSAARAEVALATVTGHVVTLVPTTSVALPLGSRAETQRFIGLLAVVVGLVLLVGCTNIAGLMLARNGQRRAEAALRVALGVSRVRLLRLFLAETLLLTSAGSLVGLFVSVWLLQASSRLVLPGGVSLGTLDFGWTVSMVGFGLAAAIVTALLCGLMPALQVLRTDVRPALQGRAPGGPGGTGRTRGLLLAGQVAIAILLVIGAALFMRSLRSAVTADVGFDADRIVQASVQFHTAGYDEARVARFYDTVVGRLRGMPGVERATFGGLPLITRGLGVPSVYADGSLRQLPQRIEVYFCGPDYARTLGLALQAGRDISDRDVEGSAAVALINESLARRLWPGRNAIGQRHTFPPLTGDVQVAGVVRDGKYRRLREAGGFAVFLPWAQHRGLASRRGTVIGRAARDAGTFVPLLQREVRAFDPDLPISATSTLEDRIGTLAMPQRMGAALLGCLSSLALALAILGVYGAVAYTVTRRSKEIGIRIALGAGTRAVVETVMSRTLAYVGAGIMIGLAAAFALTHLVEPFLFEVAPRDPLTFAAVTATVVLTTVLAGLVPALRAARITPASALTSE